MKMIGSLFYAILVLPGLLQLFTFFILLGVFALTKKYSGHKVAASLVAMGLLLALVAGFSSYWILTHLLIVGIGLVVWKKKTNIQMRRQLPGELKIVFSSDLQALKTYTAQLPKDAPNEMS